MIYYNIMVTLEDGGGRPNLLKNPYMIYVEKLTLTHTHTRETFLNVVLEVEVVVSTSLASKELNKQRTNYSTSLTTSTLL